MKIKNIEKLLTKMMVGGNMASIKLAGEIIDIRFSGSGMREVESFYIYSDAWIFLGNENDKIDYEKINEKDFFDSRRDIVVKLYDLTGYDVESVSIVKNESLRVVMNGTAVLFFPKCIEVEGNTYCESWRVITNMADGTGECCLVSLEDEELFVNKKHPCVNKIGSSESYLE